MMLAHEDANARLLDLVYGEATPAEREAIEAHVATCAACQAELASLGDTRARVRTALEDQPVPARAHARILEAATQAAAPVATAAAAAAAAAPAVVPVRAARPASGPSFWERLRGRWTLPTFATVGAVAVVVIASKVFLEPDKTMERGREIATASAPAPAAAASAAQAELEAKLAATQKESDELAKASTEAEKAQLRDEALRQRPLGPGGIAAGTSAFNSAKGGRPGLLGGGSLADRLSHSRAGGGSSGLGGLTGASSGRGVATAPAAPLPPKAKHDDFDELMGSTGSDKTAASKPAASVKHEKRDFAPPPSGWKAGAGAVASKPAVTAPAEAAPPPPAAAAPAEAPSAPQAVRKRKVAADDMLDGFRSSVPSASEPADRSVEEGEGSGPSAYAKKVAPKPAAKPGVAANAPASQAAPREKAATSPAKDAPRAVARPEQARSNQENLVEHESSARAAPPPQQPPSLETLTRRADHFFAVQHWSEAIAAYQELLRLYPDADLKTRWRERIAQAKTYVAQESAATASKKAAKAPVPSKKATTIEAAPAKE
jgi:hypothetical protein